MAISVTSEQALALSPDPASAKAARSLATPRPWSNLGQNGRSIWGACQGSGKDPYRTQVDWEGPAFQCSCPSRKFPCKHGLGLLLLLAEQPKLFSSSAEPDWVAAWIAGRQQRAEAKSKTATKEPDEAARAKRSEQRAGRVSEGIALLERWLEDLVQQGLVSAPSRGFEFWDRQASRLVDAQAPGAARLVRELGGIAVSGNGWQNRMLRAIGRLALLARAHGRLDRLSAETQCDVRTALGFPVSQSDVLALEPVRDRWLVAGQRTVQEDKLRVQRTWLRGDRTGTDAMVLEFAAGPAGFKTSLAPGTAFEASLCFFPGAAPLRALIKETHGAPSPAESLFGAVQVSEAYERLGLRVARNPWTETQPVLLRAVVPEPSESAWCLTGEANHAMPCVPDYSLLALSGGRPLDLAGEWDGERLRPLMAAVDGRFAPIRQVAP